jgi:hypothetical protein
VILLLESSVIEFKTLGELPGNQASCHDYLRIEKTIQRAIPGQFPKNHLIASPMDWELRF